MAAKAGAELNRLHCAALAGRAAAQTLSEQPTQNASNRACSEDQTICGRRQTKILLRMKDKRNHNHLEEQVPQTSQPCKDAQNVGGAKEDKALLNSSRQLRAEF